MVVALEGQVLGGARRGEDGREAREGVVLSLQDAGWEVSGGWQRGCSLAAVAHPPLCVPQCARSGLCGASRWQRLVSRARPPWRWSCHMTTWRAAGHETACGCSQGPHASWLCRAPSTPSLCWGCGRRTVASSPSKRRGCTRPRGSRSLVRGHEWSPLPSAPTSVPEEAWGARRGQGGGSHSQTGYWISPIAGPASHLPLPANLELPVRFSRPLQDVVATEKDRVNLECELSRPNVDVRWLKVAPPAPAPHCGLAGVGCSAGQLQCLTHLAPP